MTALLLVLFLRRETGGAAMKRWLAVYAAAFYAFLHLPLLTLVVFSFNASRFTRVGRIFARAGTARCSRDPQIAGGPVEQRDHRVLRDR